MNPKVTVLMPVYNASRFLIEAVNSMLNQTFTDFEFLIINDGSTDGSDEMLKTFFDERIRVINNIGNEGLIRTLNKGIALSKGEYIARMDADDISLPGRLEKQVQFLDANKDVAILATRLIQINEKGETAGYWMEDQVTVTETRIKNTLPVINCIGHPTIMMRKGVIEKFGYRPWLTYSEDWGLWLEVLAENWRIAKLEEPLLKYRIHNESVTSGINKKGVEKKIIRFKASYLSRRLFKLKFKNSDYLVLKSFLRDLIKFVTPASVIVLYKDHRHNFFTLFDEFISAWIFFRRRKSISNMFFFPFYHIGGAEKIHAAIMAIVADKRPVVFITERSSGKAMYKAFARNAEVLDVHVLSKSKLTREWLMRKIKYSAMANENLIVFGCNSKYFYDLLPFLPVTVYCIDLIHAFMHVHEIGAEHWSLPLVQRLNKRIFITGNSLNDLKTQYKNNGVDEGLLSRALVIENFVDLPTVFVVKNNGVTLQVLYVGRDSAEKRLHLIGAVAENCNNQNVPAQFTFVGDINVNIKAVDFPFCKFTGEIDDVSVMRRIYQKSDVLLLTSSREGFPLVIMEAMAYGVVPVTANVGGIAQHVHHNENGLLIESMEEPAIIQEITSAIIRLANDRKWLNKMSVNAMQYAKSHFSKENFNKSYRELLTGGRRK